MKTDVRLEGVWTAMITPFTSKGEVDLRVYRNLLKNQVKAKVTGVFVCVTTSEAPTLTSDEKKNLIFTAVQELKNTSVKIFAGIGTYNTADSVQSAQWASEAGVDGVVAVTPYYNKPSQSGMQAHFEAIANAISCDVILYNVPKRTGVNLAPETVKKLSIHPRIIALKESTANITALSELLDTLSQNKSSLDILCGDDSAFVPFYAIGATGVVSVASNLIPEVIVSIDQALKSGNFEQAKELHKKYYPLFRDLFIDSNPVPIKFAMSQMSLCDEYVRLPLLPLSQNNASKLKETLGHCNITKQ